MFRNQYDVRQCLFLPNHVALFQWRQIGTGCLMDKLGERCLYSSILFGVVFVASDGDWVPDTGPTGGNELHCVICVRLSKMLNLLDITLDITVKMQEDHPECTQHSRFLT